MKKEETKRETKEEIKEETKEETRTKKSKSENKTMNQFLGKNIAPLTVPRTENEVEAIGISVPKEERKTLKTKEVKTYEKLKEKAEEGITSKFGLLKPIDQTSNTKDFKDIYGVLTRVKELKQSILAYDMDDVFNIPSAFKEDLPATECSSLNLFSDSNDISLELVKKANRFYYLYGAEYHAENIKWSGEKVLASCDKELKDKILEEVQEYKASERGGPVYFKVMMNLVIATSDTAMRSVVNRINNKNNGNRGSRNQNTSRNNDGNNRRVTRSNTCRVEENNQVGAKTTNNGSDSEDSYDIEDHVNVLDETVVDRKLASLTGPVFDKQENVTPDATDVWVDAITHDGKTKSMIGLLDSGAGGVFVKRKALRYVKHELEDVLITANGRYGTKKIKQIATLPLPKQSLVVHTSRMTMLLGDMQLFSVLSFFVNLESFLIMVMVP